MGLKPAPTHDDLASAAISAQSSVSHNTGRKNAQQSSQETARASRTEATKRRTAASAIGASPLVRKRMTPCEAWGFVWASLAVGAVLVTLFPSMHAITYYGKARDVLTGSVKVHSRLVLGIDLGATCSCAFHAMQRMLQLDISPR